MKTCPNCNQQIYLDGKFCPRCKNKIENFEKSFRRKSFKNRFLILLWAIGGLVFSGWYLSFADYNDPRDYMIALVFIVMIFVLIFSIILLIDFFKNKKDCKSDLSTDLHFQKQQYFDGSERVLFKIKFVSFISPQIIYNLFFTDKRMIVFHMGQIKAIKVSTMKKVLNAMDEEADLLIEDLDSLIKFTPLTFSIPYSDIEEVVVRKNNVSFKAIRHFSDKSKIINHVFMLQRFSIKDKRNTDEIMPILNRFFSSKLIIKIKGRS